MKRAPKSKKPAQKKPAPKKPAPKKQPRRKEARGVVSTSPEQLAAGVLRALLGDELTTRLQVVAAHRGITFDAVLKEAAQNLLEAEFVDPTTDAKDEKLYPPTDHPLEEAPVVRSKEPGEESVHERTTLPGEVPPENGTTH
jgi:hypothetical protein